MGQGSGGGTSFCDGLYDIDMPGLLLKANV
jgi:hypothetical protein